MKEFETIDDINMNNNNEDNCRSVRRYSLSNSASINLFSPRKIPYKNRSRNSIFRLNVKNIKNVMSPRNKKRINNQNKNVNNQNYIIKKNLLSNPEILKIPTLNQIQADLQLKLLDMTIDIDNNYIQDNNYENAFNPSNGNINNNQGQNKPNITNLKDRRFSCPSIIQEKIINNIANSLINNHNNLSKSFNCFDHNITKRKRLSIAIFTKKN